MMVALAILATIGFTYTFIRGTIYMYYPVDDAYYAQHYEIFKSKINAKNYFKQFASQDIVSQLNAFVRPLDPNLFKQEAPKHFVLLELDYPQKKELPKEEKEQNDAMQKTYSVEGFPTILLTDAKGRPYAKTGYQAGGPEAYNKHLNELRQVREKRDAAFKRAEAAAGLEKANAINEGLKALEPELVMAYYSAEVDQIIGLDAEDKIGFKAKKEYSTKRAGLDKELKELAQAQKPKDFEEAIDAFIAKEKIAPADLQDLMLTKLQVLGPADLDKADALMDAVIKVDEKSELAGRAKEIKTRIVAMREQVEKSKKDPAAKEEKDEPEKK